MEALPLPPDSHWAKAEANAAHTTYCKEAVMHYSALQCIALCSVSGVCCSTNCSVAAVHCSERQEQEEATLSPPCLLPLPSPSHTM